MIFETVVVGGLGVNCYILATAAGGKAVVIDPGDDEGAIKAALARHELSVGAVVNTHGHFDHIGCDDCFRAPVYIHGDDAGMLTDSRMNGSAFFIGPLKVKAKAIEVSDGQVIEHAGVKLRVIHTPGHSRGGMCLELLEPGQGIVFTGDTLFSGSVGRSDFAGGDEAALLEGIRSKLLVLPDATKLYPGHGPATTVAREKRHNPFFAE